MKFYKLIDSIKGEIEWIPKYQVQLRTQLKTFNSLGTKLTIDNLGKKKNLSFPQLYHKRYNLFYIKIFSLPHPKIFSLQKYFLFNGSKFLP